MNGKRPAHGVEQIGEEQYIAVEDSDAPLLYSLVVLRDDQIEKIAARVIEKLDERFNSGAGT